MYEEIKCISSDNRPLLSISLITYNHVNYIEEAIQSILMQDVDFAYEIVIGDDFSNDGTQAILKEYQKKYPGIIRLNLHSSKYEEIPGRTNNIINLRSCRGKYIAMLDGDDYWISKYKLKQQVDFLETHPDYVLTFHDTFVFSEKLDFKPYLHSANFVFLQKK